jgi:drug/metabolite transporter (DMT)-like permease
VLFFATSVYGHVALKFAVDQAARENSKGTVLSALANGWGWSACLAWGVSCLLWAMALARQPLVQANALSALRYVLVCLAAWVLLGERLSWPQVLGMALLTTGILLVK